MKRKLAILLAAVMVLTLLPMTALADNTTVITVGGDVLVVPHVHRVTLPTNAGRFVVDPEGLIGTGGTPGQIVFIGNSAPIFENRSSVDMRVGVEFVLTVPGGVSAVEEAGSGPGQVAEAEHKRIRVTATTATGNVTIQPTQPAFAGTVARPIFGTHPTVFDYVLPAANHTIIFNEEQTAGRRVLSATPAIQGSQFQLAGEVNPDAAWDGTEDISLQIRFAFNPYIPVGMPNNEAIGTCEHLRRFELGSANELTLVSGVAETNLFNTGFGSDSTVGAGAFAREDANNATLTITTATGAIPGETFAIPMSFDTRTADTVGWNVAGTVIPFPLIRTATSLIIPTEIYYVWRNHETHADIPVQIGIIFGEEVQVFNLDVVFD